VLTSRRVASVDSGRVRRAGGTGSGGGGDQLRAAFVDLPRSRCGLRSLAHVLAAMCGPGHRWRCCCPGRPSDRGDFGVLKTGRRTCRRPAGAGGADAVRGCRCRARRAITTAEWRSRLDGDALLVIDLGILASPLLISNQAPHCRACPGRCRVHHLHLGTTGTPKGFRSPTAT